MRIVLIGYGNIARKHLEVFKALGCEVVASCNTSERGNLLAQQEGGITKTYTNYLEMVEREQPAAIINCVSFDRIYEVTRQLIPYKIPMLIEKPAGTSVAELQDLIQLQKHYQTPVQVALNRRHYSVIDKALKDMGGSENLQLISLEWSENPLRVKAAKNYNDEQVAKLLYGNTIHGIDLLNWISGGIDEYQVFVRKQPDFLWSMALAGKSRKGIPVNFSSTWGNVVPWRLVLHGNNKRYEFAPMETCRVFTDGAKEPATLEPDERDTAFKAGFYKQAERFLQVLQNKINGQHGLNSTLGSVKIIEDFYKRLA